MILIKESEIKKEASFISGARAWNIKKGLAKPKNVLLQVEYVKFRLNEDIKHRIWIEIKKRIGDQNQNGIDNQEFKEKWLKEKEKIESQLRTRKGVSVLYPEERQREEVKIWAEKEDEAKIWARERVEKIYLEATSKAQNTQDFKDRLWNNSCVVSDWHFDKKDGLLTIKMLNEKITVSKQPFFAMKRREKLRIETEAARSKENTTAQEKHKDLEFER